MNLWQKLVFNLRSTIRRTINSQPADFAEALELSRSLVERSCGVFASCDFVTVEKNEHCMMEGE